MLWEEIEQWLEKNSRDTPKRKGFLPKHLLVEEEKLPLSRKHIGHAAADKEEHQEEGVG